MVAASAETLVLAVYARDLGLDIECELYCDRSATLRISQRAGINKFGISEFGVSGYKRSGSQAE